MTGVFTVITDQSRQGASNEPKGIQHWGDMTISHKFVHITQRQTDSLQWYVRKSLKSMNWDNILLPHESDVPWITDDAAIACSVEFRGLDPLANSWRWVVGPSTMSRKPESLASRIVPIFPLKFREVEDWARYSSKFDFRKEYKSLLRVSKSFEAVTSRAAASFFRFPDASLSALS